MVVYYTDTSALLKQYVDEMGSDWLRSTIAPADETMVVFSQLLIIEVTSALNRRVREGAITPEEYPRVSGIFHNDCRDEYHFFRLVDLVFLSADDRLNNAASTEGLKVDNPNRHP